MLTHGEDLYWENRMKWMTIKNDFRSKSLNGHKKTKLHKDKEKSSRKLAAQFCQVFLYQVLENQELNFYQGMTFFKVIKNQQMNKNGHFI